MIYVLSGGAKAFAVIGVTYPAGSTCTCSDGTKTLKLKDTGGQGFFLIPYKATWTVACTDGKNTKSQSVEITSEGQSENVALSYELILFDGGAVVPWTARSAHPTATIGTTLYVATSTSDIDVASEITTTDKIDVTDYSTIKFNVLSYSGNRANVGISSSTSNVAPIGTVSSSAVAYDKVSEATTYSIDISEATGEYYVFIGTGGGNFSLKIDKVWLE